MTKNQLRQRVYDMASGAGMVVVDEGDGCVYWEGGIELAKLSNLVMANHTKLVPFVEPEE